jgi:dCMP deaminase
MVFAGFLIFVRKFNMRKNWLQYFMDIAKMVATRATCDRKHVGAVVVSNSRAIIATGYNGSVVGAPHCDDAGHLMEDGHCVRTIHAEMNAIAQAAHHGVSLRGSTLYCTALPCWQCFKVICNTGITQVIYDEPYRAEEHLERVYSHARAAGVKVYRLSEAGALVNDFDKDQWKPAFNITEQQVE